MQLTVKSSLDPGTTYIREWTGKRLSQRYCIGTAIADGVQLSPDSLCFTWYKSWKQKGGAEPKKYIWLIDIEKKRYKAFHTKKQAINFLKKKGLLT